MLMVDALDVFNTNQKSVLRYTINLADTHYR